MDKTIKNVKFQRHGNPTWRVYNSYKICRKLLLFDNGFTDSFEIFTLSIPYIRVIALQISRLNSLGEGVNRILNVLSNFPQIDF